MEKALFRKGDKVQYIGQRQADSAVFGEEVKPLIFPGMTATITKTKPPEKGLGLVRTKEGDLILDDDTNGYNVYTNEHGNSAIIWPRDKGQWKLTNKTKRE